MLYSLNQYRSTSQKGVSMRLSCLQEHLRRGLASVSRAAATKSTLPVLSHILLASDAGHLKLAATNLEIGMLTWIGANITAEGGVAAPARLLNDIVAGLPNDVIDLALDSASQTLRLRCGDVTAAIKCIEAEEFPTIPTIATGAPTVALPAQALREVIEQVAFAAATDDTRPILTGVACRFGGQAITLTASDGFRLARRVLPLPSPVAAAIDVLVPARALAEVARSIGDSSGDTQIIITPSGGQIVFRTEQTELVSRLIDGTYPDVQRVIPQTYRTRAVMDRLQLAQAVKLAAYIAAAATNTVKVSIDAGSDQAPGRLTISATAAEVGENQTVREGMVSGEGGQILLNARYVADVLGAINTPQLALELQHAQSPAIFRPVGVEEYVCAIMPMQVR
jgi:DNA polymerase III subunit beta